MSVALVSACVHLLTPIVPTLDGGDELLYESAFKACYPVWTEDSVSMLRSPGWRGISRKVDEIKVALRELSA